MSTDRSHRQRGFTFLEVSVALSILTLLALAVERTLTSTQDNERHLTATRRATERGQLVCYEVFRAVSASRKLFQDDTIGRDYFDALDLTRLPPAPDTRLPLIDATGDLGPDAAGSPMTGNLLLFVEESDPAACTAEAASGKIRYIDTYRFVCIYPTQTDVSLVTGAPRARDLVIWSSVPYPSHPQLLAIEDVDDRADVVADLYDRFGYVTAWDPGAAVGAGFYALSTLGTISSAAVAAPTIEEDPDLSSLGRLGGESVQLARTDAGSAYRRSVFTVDDPGVWVPDGFEVKITGASGSRKVWVHLVVESPANRGRVAVHPSTMIASARDL